MGKDRPKKDFAIVFSFKNYQEERRNDIFNKILDPIREQFPFLSTTKFMQDGEKLALVYQIDKNIMLAGKYNELVPEFEDVISEITITEQVDALRTPLNAVQPKPIDLYEYDKLIHLFKKRDILYLIGKEKNQVRKKELFMNYFSNSPKFNPNNLEKILLILRKEPFLLRNQVFKEISEKTFYSIERINEEYENLLGLEKQEETRKIFLLAYEILDKIDILSPIEYKDSILLYQNGFWKEEPLEVLDKLIIEYLEEKEWIIGKKKKKKKQAVNARIINMISRILLRKTQCTIKDFDLNESYLNLENGILDISNLNNPEFQPHSRLLWNRIQIPIKYKENMNCIAIEKFLNEILEDEYIPLIYEFLGDCLTGRIKYQKALLFTGKGANGKSTLLSLFRCFIGDYNCSETPLHKLMEDKFAVSSLENKLLNLSKDIPRKPLKYTEIFKQIVGDQELMGEKKFRPQYCFTNHSKHVFSCNIVPPTRDDTHAFFRRWIMIPFHRIFTEEEQDVNLLEKLTIKNELSGLLNKVLNGLKNLSNRRMYEIKYYSKTRNQWELFSTPLLSFIETYLEINDTPSLDENFEIEKDLLLIIYNEFLKSNGQPEIKGTNNLTRKINSSNEYGPKIKTRSYQENGQKKYVYTGIKFNDRALKEFKSSIENDMVDLNYLEDSLDKFFKD